MKTFLLLSLVLGSFFFSGCEAVIETRQPVRYGTVYRRPVYYDDRRDYRDYRDDRHDYYYRDGRRYDRYDRSNVVVVNRPVVVRQTDVYSRSRSREVNRNSSRDRHDSRDSRDNRDDRDKDKKKKKKKDKDRDDR